MLVDFNQPIFSLSEFSSHSGFNLCEGWSEVLLVNGIDDSEQEIALDIIFGSILEIGQICYYLHMSLNLLHDVLTINSGQAGTLRDKISRQRKYFFLPLRISLINPIEQFLSWGRKI